MRGMKRWTKFSMSGGTAPYVFLTPTALLFLFIFVFPIVFVVWVSLFRWNMLKPQAGMRFVGLGNFTDLLSDSMFWESFWVTVRFVVFSVPIGIVLGLALALLLNRAYRGKKWIQSLLLTPMMVAPVAVYLSWKFLLEPTFGIVNHVLRTLGLPTYGWFADVKTALASVVLVDIWTNVPFIFLVLYAALQSVPHDPVESAQVDGANRFQVFWHVTLPSIKPVLLVITIVRMMDAIRVFDNIFVLTRGGPANSTRTIQYMDYDLAFNAFDVGKGSALAIIIVVIILIVGSLMIREMNRMNDELRQ